MKSKPSSAAATKSLNSVAGLELNDEIIPMLEVPLLALDEGECTGVESTLDLLGTGAAGGDNGATGAASVCATASADSLAFSRCLFMCNIKGPTFNLSSAISVSSHTFIRSDRTCCINRTRIMPILQMIKEHSCTKVQPLTLEKINSRIKSLHATKSTSNGTVFKI